uniref:Uncharacterized protein n=1 Tax=Pithovirus LCPAC401 TaxID=2506595 RepID=A0A481Z9A7_9VIRU|nr:MAG: hypothetical protein LCPAC401_00250 [Pithovirus LCPAC401]
MESIRITEVHRRKDESIDWEKLMEGSKGRTQEEIEITVYIQIKLEG